MQSGDSCWLPARCVLGQRSNAGRRKTNSHGRLHQGILSLFLVVQVGGVGIDHELDVMFDPKNGDPGWKLIEGEAGDQYQAWAQNREPDGIEYEIACQ
ncbi:hypothetical protein P4105_11995 [Pseudomonas aeruginosa]|nr:hypothetical protein [Pseudomonas aeruginosa]